MKMNKYISPSYNAEVIESKDIITASKDIEDNGKATVYHNGTIIEGDKGTAAGNFLDIF